MEVSSYLNRLHDYSNSDNSNSDNSNFDNLNCDNSNLDNSNSENSKTQIPSGLDLSSGVSRLCLPDES